MTDRIGYSRIIGGDYFTLCYRKSPVKRLTTYIDHYLNMFNPDDYYIFKTTRNQRLVSVEEMKEFKYSGYTFFKKDLYDVNDILHWIEFIKTFGGIQFLSKLPPFKPEDKIEIRK